MTATTQKKGFLAWVAQLLWLTETPRDRPREPHPERLAKTFFETMWFGVNPSGGTPFEDAEHASIVCGALTSLLQDYRENRPQTPEETAIASALDYIHRTYLETP